MQKVKHDFQPANKEISSGNVYMIQKCFTLFECNSYLTFKLSTACTTLNDVCCTFNSILKLDRNHADKTSSLKYTHGTLQKHNDLLLKKRSYLVLNEEEKKNKKKKLNRIITLDGGNYKT